MKFRAWGSVGLLALGVVALGAEATTIYRQDNPGRPPCYAVSHGSCLRYGNKAISEAAFDAGVPGSADIVADYNYFPAENGKRPIPNVQYKTVNLISQNYPTLRPEIKQALRRGPLTTIQLIGLYSDARDIDTKISDAEDRRDRAEMIKQIMSR